MRKIVVTGGSGFIGSAVVRRLHAAHADVRVVNYDALTYAANPESDAELKGNPRYLFIRAGIDDRTRLKGWFDGAWGVVHLAAETHVDRSLQDGGDFVATNVLGTYNVLEAARSAGVSRVLIQSTDEVYGPTPFGVSVGEDAPLRPRSPYSASKLAAEQMALAFYHSYGLPVIVSRPTNTVGPRQHPEKMLPLFTIKAFLGQPLPLYGDGRQERDRLFVEDHAAALDLLLHEGTPGEVYNVAAGNYAENLWVAEAVCALTRRPFSLIAPVTDRPGHDARYRLNAGKLQALGWAPTQNLWQSVEQTVAWYQANRPWWEPLWAQMHEGYLQRQYGQRVGV